MYVVGFVELSQRGREKGQSVVIMINLKVFWLPGRLVFFCFFFFKSPPSLIEGLDDVMGRKGGEKNAAAPRAGQKEGDEVAAFGLGEGWGNLERAMLQRPRSKVKMEEHLLM